MLIVEALDTSYVIAVNYIFNAFNCASINFLSLNDEEAIIIIVS